MDVRAPTRDDEAIERFSAYAKYGAGPIVRPPRSSDASGTAAQTHVWPAALDFEALSKREPEPPKFIIDDWLPCGYSTLFAGHGGVGKSGIALFLAVCIALGLSFFGLTVQRRRVLYLSCEDREDILHWRLSRICRHLQINLVHLKDWLEVVDLVGRNTLLWDRDPKTGNTFTVAYGELAQRFVDTERQVVFVDGIADVYGGSENTRGEVKQFVNSLVSLIDPAAGAVILIGHVAKLAASGMETSEGYSGSTGWHNSVRARWYLRPETLSEDAGSPERTGKLILELQKSNLGAVDKRITFEWSDSENLFVGQQIANEMRIDKKLRDTAERDGILSAIRASEMAGVSVPAAVSGPRTAYHVLSVRSEFPASLKGDKRLAGRFRRHVESMRQEGLIQTGTIKTPARRYIDILKCANA